MKSLRPSPQQPATSRNGRPAVATLLVLAALGLSACGSSTDEKAPTPPPPSPPPTVGASCKAFPDATNTAVTGELATATSSASGGALTWSLVSQPAFGTLSLSASTGSWTYTPTTPARGYLDTFTWKVTDSTGANSQASASIIYGKRRIMPLGDSITAGVESYADGVGDLPAPGSQTGYRKSLQTLLASGGYAADFVGSQAGGTAAGIVDPSHEGHSGFTTSQIDAGASAWLANAQPDIVLLHIGTNDLNVSAVPVATAVNNVDSILAKARTFATVASNPPLEVVLAKIVPARPEVTPVPPTTTYNAALTTLYDGSWADGVNSNDRIRVRLADMHSAVNASTDMTPIAIDTVGLHPAQSGYAKMAQVWYDTLVQQGMIARCP